MENSDYKNNFNDINIENALSSDLYSKEAEEGLLGSFLTHPESLARSIGYISADDFYYPLNKELFNILVETHNNNLDSRFILNGSNSFNIDESLIIDKAKMRGFPQINRDFLVNISAAASFVSQQDSLLYHISHLSKLRKLQAGLYETAKSINDHNGKTKEDYANIVQNLLFDLNGSSSQDFDNLKDASQEYLDMFKERLKNNVQISGIPTGYGELDKTINGLNKGALIILAARPGVGKTTFALNLILNVLEKKSFRTSDASDDVIDIMSFDIDKIDEKTLDAPGKRIALFTLEMPTQQIVEKLYSRKAMVPLMKLKNPGIMSDIEKAKILQRLTDVNEHEFRNYQLFIDEGTSNKISMLAWKIRTLNRRQKVDLVVVDYLQLLSDDGGGNRQNEISVISRSLKRLAIELNIPIVALSQLSRKVEERADKRPIISDLRESGSIEQDADIVMFLYQQDKKNKEEVKSIDGEGTITFYPVELLIKKHRAGEQKDLLFYFNKTIGDFISEADFKLYQKAEVGGL